MGNRDIPWSHPLKVTVRAGMDRTFASVYDALDYLEKEWPQKRGDRYDRAVLACRRGLNGLAPAEVERPAGGDSGSTTLSSIRSSVLDARLTTSPGHIAMEVVVRNLLQGCNQALLVGRLADIRRAGEDLSAHVLRSVIGACDDERNVLSAVPRPPVSLSHP